VETVIAVSKAGRDYVKVDRYKPNADPVPKVVLERSANRTPTQKADAASGASNDDIPFLWLVPMLCAIAAAGGMS